MWAPTLGASCGFYPCYVYRESETETGPEDTKKHNLHCPSSGFDCPSSLTRRPRSRAIPPVWRYRHRRRRRHPLPTTENSKLAGWRRRCAGYVIFFSILESYNGARSTGEWSSLTYPSITKLNRSEVKNRMQDIILILSAHIPHVIMALTQVTTIRQHR